MSSPTESAGRPRDFAFILALLSVAAVPLLALRGQPAFNCPVCQLAIWLVGAWLVLGWERAARRAEPRPGSAEPGTGLRWRRAGFAAGLVVVALSAFYMPMREHFWAGGDEVHTLTPEVQRFWSEAPVTGQRARPTWGLGPMLGQMLTPGRIEGHLWLAGTLCVLNGLLLFGIMRRVLPGDPAVAAAAGVLLICHRGDSSRFFVMWTGNWYWTALALLLLGSWLLLESARTGRRVLLVAGCAALAVSLLGSEAGYPLAALGPVLLWLSGVRGARLAAWSFAWLGTAGLMAVRYALYMLTADGNYQAALTGGVRENPGGLVANLWPVAAPFLTWFEGFRFSGGYWRWAGAGLAGAAALGAVLLAARGVAGRWRAYAVGIPVAAAAAAAGLAPFVVSGGAAFRTQFYTAPGQAALLALALGAACRPLGRRAGAAALAALIGLSAANAAAENRRAQAAADRHVNFAKTVHIFHQLRAATPTVDTGTLIVLVVDDGVPNPLGWNFYMHTLSRDLLGYGALVTTAPDALTELTWERDGVLNSTAPAPRRDLWRYPYERIVAFRLRADGTVSLLRKLPPDLLPADARAEAYDPLALLRPGPITPVPYLRYPRWVKPPRDVIDPGEGLVFGAGWSDMRAEGGRVFRRADPGAELVVNPVGQNSRAIRLELEAEGAPGGACRVEARDLGGRVLAAAPLAGRAGVELLVPTDPARASLITLWAVPEKPTGTSETAFELRVFAPPGTRLPAPNEVKQDVARSGLRLGENWYALETAPGESFRWFTTGAELVVRGGGGELLLEVEGGPSLGGGPGQLRVVAPGGRVLHEAELSGRRELRCALSADLPAGAVLRLDVVGGGQATPGDPRILNARVFRCEVRK